MQRPYACKTAGIPLRCTYDFPSRRFTFDYINPIPTNHPLASAVPTLPQAEAEPGSPPLVGVACRARETEIYLPRRRYGQAARDGNLRVKLRDGDGDWRYDNEVSTALVLRRACVDSTTDLDLAFPSKRQTLYVLHRNTTPGYLHSIQVTVAGPADRASLRRWYEPPAWILDIEPVWINLALVVVIGGYMGIWLLSQAFGDKKGAGEYVETGALAGEL